MEAAIHGVLGKLDPYSNYINPDEMSRFKTSVESQFGGIGIQITIDHDQLKILSPIVGSPAYRAGLQAGDHILEIEGKSTDGLTLDDAVRKLKGEAGTSVTMSVIHAGGGKKEVVTVKRELIHVDTVMGDQRKESDAWDFMLDHDSHIGYVRITGFSRDTAHDLRTAMDWLQSQGLKGLIIDLRFNPGGLLTSAIEISDMFISKGRIVSTKGRNTAGAHLGRPGAGNLRRLSDGNPRQPLQRQRQRDFLGLPARPPSRGDHRRAHLGQGERAERHRAGKWQEPP